MLDDIKQIKQQDKDDMLTSVDSIPHQAIQAWEETQKIDFPEAYKEYNKIIVCGMGGSRLGTDIVTTLFKKKLKAPILLVNHYDPPGYLDKDSLVLLSSYSGNTEEVLSFAGKAQSKKMFVISSGGKLAELAKKKSLPAYVFDPIHNPCGQPRIGLGYTIVGQIGMFSRLGLFDIDGDEVTATLEKAKSYKNQWGVQVLQKDNLAKQFAAALDKKIIVFVGAEFLMGNAHAARNQLHENAKQFGDMFEIPEMNHHLLEGLRFPRSIQEDLGFVFFVSQLYSKKIQQRIEITKQILDKYGIEHHSFKPEAPTRFGQMVEVLIFGMYMNLYVALLKGINPSPVSYVEDFKAALKKLE